MRGETLSYEICTTEKLGGFLLTPNSRYSKNEHALQTRGIQTNVDSAKWKPVASHRMRPGSDPPSFMTQNANTNTNTNAHLMHSQYRLLMLHQSPMMARESKTRRTPLSLHHRRVSERGQQPYQGYPKAGLLDQGKISPPRVSVRHSSPVNDRSPGDVRGK